LSAPYLTYHRADAGGELTVTRPIDVAAPTMMHDFQLTAGHVVFMDLPVVFDLQRARAGVGMPYAWTPDYGARLGVLRRDDPYGEVRWFDTLAQHIQGLSGLSPRTEPAPCVTVAAGGQEAIGPRASSAP
jgi:carotenoid cleavage dioxygenase